MKVKITGQYQNGLPYVAVIPKESLTEVAAQALIDGETWKNNSSTSDGIGLDVDSLTAELYDDEIIEPVQNAKLKIVLYEDGLLSDINAYMATKNGITQIYWTSIPMIDFYHEVVQNAITELNMPLETAKDKFRRALLVE